MSPLASIRGTGGTLNDIAVSQNQNTLTHPYDHTKGEFMTLTTGPGSWTVPDGVTKICVVCIGGGGGSCDFQFGGNVETAGGGGGGGGLSWGNNITVKPGDSLPYYVGAAGGPSGPSGPSVYYGEDGGDTWLKDSDGAVVVLAEGGEGGVFSEEE